MQDKLIVIIERQTLAAVALKELALVINPNFNVQVHISEPESLEPADLLIYSFKGLGDELIQDMTRVADHFKNVSKLFMVNEVSLEGMKLASVAGFQMLAKTSSCFNILDSIQAALKLKIDFLEPLTAPIVTSQSPIKLPTGSKPLTVRHVTVLECMLKGMSSRQIAEHMDLSIDTINAHSREAFQRLNADNRSTALGNYVQAKRLASKLFPVALEKLLQQIEVIQRA